MSRVSRLVLGTARWALAARPDRALLSATVAAALDAGIDRFDTARAYSPPGRPGEGERLLAEALGPHARAGRARVATKGGHWRRPDGSFAVDARPATLRSHVEASLRVLDTERLDRYFLHWPDPAVPLAESIGALADLRTAGLIAEVGVCNVGVAQLEAACAAGPVAAVQNRLAYLGVDDPVRERCAVLGLEYEAYSSLGGPDGPGRLEELTRREPRVAALAARLGATGAQLALAWLLAQGAEVVPVLGAGREGSVRASAAAATLTLVADDLALLDEVRPRPAPDTA
ncbi:aldo/keto reductase [Nocardioides sp. LHD-245]|uniref:aldo/keto reductase n=1 Tax=Nocardioides sp. LHD-245 TaxID=3051387 RepID=UPI0027E1E548|nr:aldo/keto reductase [Nocardioides sp. LHD-245]